MKVNATIKKKEIFDITINGIEHTGFTKSEEWNGLECYENNQGKIITTGTNFPDSFFKLLVGDEEQEANVIMISPYFFVEE